MTKEHDLEKIKKLLFSSVWSRLKNGDFQEVESVLQRGFDINTLNDEGKTLLQKATAAENTKIVEFLLKNKANPNLKDKEEYTALRYAILLGNSTMVESLLNAKADIDLQDNDGYTPLSRAILSNKIEIIKILVNAKAKLNLQNNYGLTPLHNAISKGNKELVEILLQAGADPNILDNSAHYPMDYAHRFYNKHIIELLKKHNALSTIEERKLLHLGLNIKSPYDFSGLDEVAKFNIFSELLNKLNQPCIDSINEAHPEKKIALNILSNLIPNIRKKVFDLKQIECTELSNEEKIRNYQEQCANLKLDEHYIIESGYKKHTNYLVVNLEKDNTYRVQLCERSGHVAKDGKAVVPYIIVSKEELNEIIEKAVDIKYKDEESARNIIFGGKKYTSKLFGFNAKIRDDISMQVFKQGTCTISNLKTATRLILMDNVVAANKKLELKDRCEAKEVYKIYSAAIFDIALDDYQASKNTFFQGEQKEKIIQEAKAHSNKKSKKIDTTPAAEVKKSTPPPKDDIEKLIDLIVDPVKKPNTKHTILVSNRTNDYSKSFKKILVDTIKSDAQLTDTLKNNPDKLEIYANSVLRALSMIEFKGQKGAYFIKNREKAGDNILYTIANFILSALSCVVSLSTEPMKNWYNNKPQVIAWSPTKFEEFLKDPNKYITPEQISKGKHTLDKIIKAEFEKQNKVSERG